MYGKVKLAGLWEFGWSAPFNEYDLWGYLVQEFEVMELIMSPVTGILRDVTEYPSLVQAVERNPDYTPVVLDEHGEHILSSYQHPVNALYLFGKAGTSVMPLFDDPITVRVETPKLLGGLWPHQVAGIVLHDRWIKHGSGD